MDIGKFNTVELCEKGKWVKIKDFDGMETDIEFLVLGVDSKKYKAQINRLVKQNEISKDKGIDPEKLEASTIRTLVAITEDWRNVELNGKPLDCTPDNLEMVYTNAPYIAGQIIDFAKERTHFLD